MGSSDYATGAATKAQIRAICDTSIDVESRLKAAIQNGEAGSGPWSGMVNDELIGSVQHTISYLASLKKQAAGDGDATDLLRRQLASGLDFVDQDIQAVSDVASDFNWKSFASESLANTVKLATDIGVGAKDAVLAIPKQLGEGLSIGLVVVLVLGAAALFIYGKARS